MKTSTKDELKDIFQRITDKYGSDFEGYITMSNKSPLIFSTLPLWDNLHNEANFIIEASLNKGSLCICIRQYNGGFLYQEFDLDCYPHKEILEYKTINNKIAKVAHIWEECQDTCCENLPTLKLTFSIFAGFKEKENGQI